MENGQLGVGSGCFHEGKLGVIVAAYGRQHWAVMFDPSDVAVTLPRTNVQPLACDLFDIGDRVRSTYSKFWGTVTGYEAETNRVVCASDKIGSCSNERTRYAYKVTELRHIKEMELEVDRLYDVTLFGNVHPIRVRALQHVSNRSAVMLYRVDDGHALGTVPKVIDLDDLQIPQSTITQITEV